MPDTSKEWLQVPHAQDGSLTFRTRVEAMTGPHHHDELELNLVTEGTAAYLLGERRYDLHRHTLVWLFPGQNHILLDQSSHIRMWLGIFTPVLLERFCTTALTRTLLQRDPIGVFSRRLAEDAAERLAGLFRHVAERGDPATANAGLGYALLAAWEAFLQADEVPSGTDVHPAVERAARLLRDEEETLGIDQIAARVGMSASYLSTLFRQQTGMALTEFRNKQRLDRFLRLYGQGRRLTLIEAAFEAGFGSYAQFHRVFRDAMGVRPQEYRRRQEKGFSGPDGEQDADTERKRG